MILAIRPRKSQPATHLGLFPSAASMTFSERARWDRRFASGASRNSSHAFQTWYSGSSSYRAMASSTFPRASAYARPAASATAFSKACSAW